MFILDPAWQSFAVQYDGHVAISRCLLIVALDAVLLLVAARSLLAFTQQSRAPPHALTRPLGVISSIAASIIVASAAYATIASLSALYVPLHTACAALFMLATVIATSHDTPLPASSLLSCTPLLLSSTLLLHSAVVRSVAAGCADPTLAAVDMITAVSCIIHAAAASRSGGGTSPAVREAAAAPLPHLDAYSAASGVAFATLSFMDALFDRGDAVQLSMQDVPAMPPSVATHVWMDALWVRLIAHASTPHPESRGWLLRMLFSLFGTRWCALGALQALSVALSFSGPLLLNALLSYLDADSGSATASPWYGMLWACLLVAAAVAGAFISTHFNVAALALQLQLRAGVIGAAYRCMLKCPPIDFAGFSAGRVNNFVSVDVQKLMDAVTSIHQFWSLPVQVGVTLWLMYTQVQWAFVAGLCVLVLFTPINMVISRRIGLLTAVMMTHRDERVRRTGELLAGIRTIKLHAWEIPLLERLHVVRQLEVRALSSRKYLDAVCVLLWASTPPLISLATFATVVLTSRGSDRALSTASVFTTVSLLNMLIFPMNAFPWVLTGVLEAFVSLHRLETFFVAATHASSAADDADEAALQVRPSMKQVVLASISGAWTFCAPPRDERQDEEDGAAASGVRVQPSMRFVLHTTPSRSTVLAPLRIERGQLVVVAGPVGAGKSALLHALLGNLASHVSLDNQEVASPRRTAYMHVPALRNVTCTVAYAPQAAWIMSASVRDNIVHASPWDAGRYARVLTACALHDDLRTFGDGDETEVSATMLSGGQAQRIALARALFSDGELLLLDDVTSALDARVSTVVWLAAVGRRQLPTRSPADTATAHPDTSDVRADILDRWHGFDMGLQSFLRAEGRSCVAVTHDPRCWRDADRILYLSNGEIVFDGTPASLPVSMWPEAPHQTDDACCRQSLQPATSALATHSDNVIKDVDTAEGSVVQSEQAAVAATRNVAPMEEARARGAVRVAIMSRYLVSAGGCLSLIVLLSLTLMQLTRNGTDWWLSVWSAVDAAAASAVATDTFSNPNAGLEALLSQWTDRQLLTVLACIVAVNFLITCVRAISFARACLAACQDVHDTLLAAVAAAPMRFHDVTSAGTLLNRFSADQYSTDETLPFQLNILLAQTWGIAGTLLVLGFATSGIFLLVTPVIALVYYRLQARYRNTSRELKRLDSVTRSPLYNHIADSLRGRDVIRAGAVHRTVTSIQHQRCVGTLDYEWSRNTTLADDNQRTSWISGLASSWLGLRLQLIGACVQALVAFAAVLMRVYLDTAQAAAGDDGGCTAAPVQPPLQGAGSVAQNVAGLAGLALSYAIPIVGSLQGFIGAFTETEKELVAVERAMEYMDVMPEACDHAPTKLEAATVAVDVGVDDIGLASPLLSLNAGERDATSTLSPQWTLRSGTIFISGLTLRYPGAAAPALDGITLHVRSGEKLGICGRTGSGKSSLIAALWRLAPWQHGTILLDGMDTRCVPLHALRAQLCAIPQEPLLFSGSVRFNLDPTNVYTDAQVEGAVRACFAGHGSGAARIALTDVVQEGGKNLSHGERQLLCMARAILKRAPIVCVDEPTANTDADTETALTDVMERAFTGATILMVAHRVHTLMRCDRVVVMSHGRIVESGVPATLASTPGSEFAALVAAATRGNVT